MTVQPTPLVMPDASRQALPQVMGAAAAPALVVEQTANSFASRGDVQEFTREMVRKHHFSSEKLLVLFGRARVQPEVIALMNRPAEAKPWHVYRELFLTAARIQNGVSFWRAQQPALARAEQTYSVPAEVVVAILGVETSYGDKTGNFRVFEALATLAFDYPRRAAYFRQELEHYLLLTREEGIEPLSLHGSYAGAMGLGQFMPSSYRAYAVDFDGDRHRDLWSNPHDAIGSIAHYLHRHRWQRGAPIATRAWVTGDPRSLAVDTKLKKPTRTLAELRLQGITPAGRWSDQQPALLVALEGKEAQEYWLGFHNFYVITRYNQSPLYAMAVYQLSQEIRARSVTSP